MRHLLRVHPRVHRRVLPRAPALRYGVLGWLLLSLIFTLPRALDRWAPQAHLERSLTSFATVPDLQWQLLLLIALATGVVIAAQTRPGAHTIISAFVAVICAVWGSWLVYWAVVQLAPSLWPPPGTAPQQPSPSLTVDLSILLLVSCIVVPLGALLGAVSSVLGYVLQYVVWDVRRSLTPSTRATARARPHAR